MSILKKASATIGGSMLLSFGINVFLTPYEVLDGGVIGIGLVIHYLFDYQVGLTIILCSLPVFLLAWFKDRLYFYNSLYGLCISSLMIDILQPSLRTVRFWAEPQPLFSAIFGGVFVGLGIGIMLLFKTSTGGTDLLAQIIANAFKLNVGILIFTIDFVIVLLGGLFISKEAIVLSLITIFMVGITTSLVTTKIIHY
ncbi:YitT family protein [Aquibacillus kalidii]|uniref:YitT family protein n=1 Tax=Aquibacillus kalidii TaxID=2762597 RepID=UPI002E27E440|nr:YitT family protein [Aquibacillus kalidii]